MGIELTTTLQDEKRINQVNSMECNQIGFFFQQLKLKGIQIPNQLELINNINKNLENIFEGFFSSDGTSLLFKEYIDYKIKYLLERVDSKKNNVSLIINFHLIEQTIEYSKYLKELENYTEITINQKNGFINIYKEFINKFKALSNYFFGNNDNLKNYLYSLLENNLLEIEDEKILHILENLQLPKEIILIYLDLIAEYKSVFSQIYNGLNKINKKLNKEGNDKDYYYLGDYQQLYLKSLLNNIDKLSLSETIDGVSALLNIGTDYLKKYNNIKIFKHFLYFSKGEINEKLKTNINDFFNLFAIDNTNFDFNGNQFINKYFYYKIVNKLIKRLFDIAGENKEIHEDVLENLYKFEDFKPIKVVIKLMLKKCHISNFKKLNEKLNLIKTNKIFETQLKVSHMLVSLFNKYDNKFSPLMKMQSRNLLWKLLKEKKMNIDILEFIDQIQNIFVENIEGENISSILHILESVNDCLSIPELPIIQIYLNQFGNKISQYEFFIIIAIFHDIHKSYVPVQFLSGLKGINGKNLSSHQFDSSKFIMEQKSNTNSDFYNAIKDLFEKRNIDQSKIEDFIEIIAKVINGHAVNTEYIQIDTLKGIGNIIDYINGIYENINTYGTQFIKLKFANLLKEDIIKEIIDKETIEKLSESIHSNEGIQYFRKNIIKHLIKAYLKSNLGKDISLQDINLKEIEGLLNYYPQIVKVNEIQELLNNNKFDKSTLECLIDGKIEIIKNIKPLINKYLHNGIENQEQEAIRFIFNLNDIKGYLNPSSYSFIKLIGLNPISCLISSPLNSSLAVLCEIKLHLQNHKLGSKEQYIYKNMYNVGIQNILYFCNQFENLLNEEVSQQLEGVLKKHGKTYRTAFNNIINNFHKYNQDDQMSYKLIFVEIFTKLCINLGLQEIYPKDFDDYYYTCLGCNNSQEIFQINENGQISINPLAIDKNHQIKVQNGDILIGNIPYKGFINNNLVENHIEYNDLSGKYSVINKHENLIKKIKKAKISECFVRLLQAFKIESVMTSQGNKYYKNDFIQILNKKSNIGKKEILEIQNLLKKLIDEEFAFDYKVIQKIDIKYMPYYGKDLLIFEKH